VSDGFDIRLETPEEWRTSPWHRLHPTVLTVEGIGEPCALVSGVLVDGTNLHVLTFPGGQRMLRCGPHNDWALEERYIGLSIDSAPLEKLWRAILADVRTALAQATQENGGRRPGA